MIRRLGLNLGPFNNGSPEQVFADVVRTLPGWANLGQPYSVGDQAALVGPDLWPQHDCDCQLTNVGNPSDIAGTYRVVLQGQCLGSTSGADAMAARTDATGIRIPSTDGGIMNASFNPDTWTTTADLVINPSNDGQSYFEFENTVRSKGAARDTGFSSLKVMRPLSPGATKSYDPATKYTTQWLKAVAPWQGQPLRFMDPSCVDNNGTVIKPAFMQTVANRTRPDNPIQTGSGLTLGASWETMVDIANAAGCGMWFPFPDWRSPDYGRAALDYFAANLEGELYLTQANENWNTSGNFPQNGRLGTFAADPAIAPTLRFDGNANDYEVGWRYAAYALDQLRKDAQAAYGPGAIGTRVFPIVDGQAGNADVLYQQLLMLRHLVRQELGAGADVGSIYPAGGGGWYCGFARNPYAPGATLDSMFAGGPSIDTLIAAECAMLRGFGVRGKSGYEGGRYVGNDVIDGVAYGQTDLTIALMNDPRFGPYVTSAIAEFFANCAGMDFAVGCIYSLSVDAWRLIDSIHDLDTAKYRAAAAYARGMNGYTPAIVPAAPAGLARLLRQIKARIRAGK